MQLAKTPMGHQVMKDRSVALTPRQRAAFILIDGKRTVDQLLAVAGQAGVCRADLDKLLELGLVANVRPAPALGPESLTVVTEKDGAVVAAGPQPVDDPAPTRTPQEKYAQAYPIATRLTAGLGLRGVMLNIAVEGAGGHEALLAVAPRILAAVGPEKFAPLDKALNGD
jgi:hypothetical protein